VLTLIACFILLSLGAQIEARAEIGPRALDKARNDTAQVKERLQGEAEKWPDEKQAVLEEIEYLKLRLDWLENRIGKYRSTLEKNEGFFHELEQERKESENLKLSLEPYLDEVVTRLGDFIGGDLRFLGQEREKRLAFLRDSLNDCSLGLSEKTRRILEALQVEADYGKTLHKTEEVVSVGGEPLRVNLFRLGRLALLYQSADRSRVGFLNRETGEWEELPRELSGHIASAMELAEGKRSAELVTLPVGRLQRR
jgi:hypothetical protein